MNNLFCFTSGATPQGIGYFHPIYSFFFGMKCENAIDFLTMIPFASLSERTPYPIRVWARASRPYNCTVIQHPQ